MKKLIINLFLLFFATQCTAAPAMYSVDYKLLICLHPLMAMYDPVYGQFLRSDINFTDLKAYESVSKQIVKNSQKAMEQTEEIDKKLTALIVELEKLRMTPREWENPQSAKTQKALSLNQQIENLNAKKDAIWENVMSPKYISKKQSDVIINQVLNEIDSQLINLSKELGGALIIDSDYQAIQLQPKSITDLKVAGGTPMSIRLYQDVLNFEMPEILPMYSDIPENVAAYKKMVMEGLESDIAKVISKSPLYGAIPGLRGRMVLVGSRDFDLTNKVLERIFKSHRVKPDIANKILQQISQ